MRRRLLGAAVIAAVTLSVGSSPATAAGPAVCPTVIAHAGGKYHAPENTVDGINVVASQGARWIEVDVRWSKGDGTSNYPGWPVLMHDANTMKTTGTSLTVADTGLTALLKLDAANYSPKDGAPKWNTLPAFSGKDAEGRPNSPVPYAHEFLEAFNQRTVSGLLDVKVTPNRPQADLLMLYINRFPQLKPNLVYMGSPASVAAMRSWYPNDLTYWIIEYPPADTLRPASFLSQAKGYAVPASYKDLSSPAVTYWKSVGKTVAVWTSDSEEWDNQTNWKKVADYGANFLITNQAATATDYYAGYCST